MKTSCTYYRGYDNPSYDLGSTQLIPYTGHADCCKACSKKSKCQGWVFDYPSGKCYFKERILLSPRYSTNPDVASGFKWINGVEPAIELPKNNTPPYFESGSISKYGLSGIRNCTMHRGYKIINYYTYDEIYLGKHYAARPDCCHECYKASWCKGFFITKGTCWLLASNNLKWDGKSYSGVLIR